MCDLRGRPPSCPGPLLKAGHDLRTLHHAVAVDPAQFVTVDAGPLAGLVSHPGGFGDGLVLTVRPGQVAERADGGQGEADRHRCSRRQVDATARGD